MYLETFLYRPRRSAFGYRRSYMVRYAYQHQVLAV
jgi:hypothetical protein